MPNSSKGRPYLCAFTFTDGRHCRMPRRDGHPYLCAFHTRKESQALAGQRVGQDVRYFLSGAFLSACDVSLALGRVFSATAQGQIKPKTATTLAYLGQTLVQTLQLAQHEYVQSFGADNWRKAVRDAHNQSYDYIYPPDQSPAEPPPQAQPPAPVSPAVEPVSTPNADPEPAVNPPVEEPAEK